MKDNGLKIFEFIAFIYFFIGALCGLLIEYTQIRFGILEIVVNFYMFTLVWSPIIYLIFGCILCKHRYYLMNIIDGVLCFFLTSFYPIPLFVSIYELNKYLYYFLGGCFSFLPLFFCIIDMTKINLFHLLKTITRIFMIIFMITIMLMLQSCSGIGG